MKINDDSAFNSKKISYYFVNAKFNSAPQGKKIGIIFTSSFGESKEN